MKLFLFDWHGLENVTIFNDLKAKLVRTFTETCIEEELTITAVYSRLRKRSQDLTFIIEYLTIYY